MQTFNRHVADFDASSARLNNWFFICVFFQSQLFLLLQDWCMSPWGPLLSTSQQANVQSDDCSVQHLQNPQNTAQSADGGNSKKETSIIIILLKLFVIPLTSSRHWIHLVKFPRPVFSLGRAVCLVCERARAPRLFLFGKGHHMRKL